MTTRIRNLCLLLALAAFATTAAAAERLTVANPDPTMAPVKMMTPQNRDYLVVESFEGAVPPVGWTTMTSGEATPWVQTDDTANSGSYSAAVYWGDQGAWQDEWLVSPAISTAGLTTLILSFAEAQSDWAYYGYQHDIMISTTVPDDPAAFTSLLTMTPADHPIGADWQQVSLNLDAWLVHPTLYVAFRYTGSWADTWYVDDVLIYEPYAHDVAAVSVTPNGLTCFPETDVSPAVTLVNMGQNEELADVSLTISLDGVPFYEEVAQATLAVGGQATVDFPGFTTELGEYVMTATVQLGGDEYPANDVAIGTVSCVDQVRTPFGILYTNWGCGPCVAANQALDDWYPAQGNNACLMRVHVYWPADNDPMYLANVEENTFLLDLAPTNVNGVPTLYMDNTYDMWDYFQDDWPATVGYGYMMSAATPSPLTVASVGYDADDGEAEIFLDTASDLPAGDYRLFVAVTEDGIEALGPNGEPIHNQAFRRLYPGTEATPIETTAGLHAYNVPLALDDTWVFDNLRVTCWVQSLPDGPVLNAGTAFLHDGVVSNEQDHPGQQETPRFATALHGAHPNPFNPQTTITFSVARPQPVQLSIFDLSGRFVAPLASGTFTAGEHAVRWDGRDAAGQAVASGTYLVHMASDDAIQVSKILLMR